MVALCWGRTGGLRDSKRGFSVMKSFSSSRGLCTDFPLVLARESFLIGFSTPSSFLDALKEGEEGTEDFKGVLLYFGDILPLRMGVVLACPGVLEELSDRFRTSARDGSNNLPVFLLLLHTAK